MTVVSGVIVFSNVLTSSNNATVIIRYEDSSRVGDISPRIIAEKVIRGVVINSANPCPIRFSLNIPQSELSAGYNLSVHVDVNRTGKIDIGDYITTRAIPLSAPTSSLNVTVDPVQ